MSLARKGVNFADDNTTTRIPVSNNNAIDKADSVHGSKGLPSSEDAKSKAGSKSNINSKDSNLKTP